MKLTNYYGDEIDVILDKATYGNGNLAIQLWCKEGPYATLTTNLGVKLPSDQAYVDTNNCPWAEEFIKANALGEPMESTRQSGFCTYPLYRFN